MFVILALKDGASQCLCSHKLRVINISSVSCFFWKIEIKGKAVGITKSTKIVIFCLGIVGAAGAAGYWVYNSTPNLSPTQVHMTPQGREFWHFPMKDVPQSAISIVWNSDFSGLPKGLERGARIGVRLMIEGGAGGMDAADIVAEFGALDAGSHIFASPEFVQGFVVTSEGSSERAAELSNMVLAEPAMEEKWFKRIRRQEMKAISESLGQSFIVAWNTARRFMLGDHAYDNYLSADNYKNLGNLTLADVKNWHQKNFTRDNLIVTSAGSMRPEKIGTLIDRALKGLPTATAPKNAISFEGPHLEGQTILVHKPDAKKTTLLLLGAIPPAKTVDPIAYFLAQSVLGSGKQSRLFKAIRGDLRAAYQFGANLNELTKNYRLLSIKGEVDPDKLVDVLAKVKEVYREFKEEGISLIEFPIVKKLTADFIENQFKKPGNVAFMLMNARREGRSEQFLSQIFVESDKLSRSKTNKIIRENFPEFSNLLTIIVSPDRDIIAADCIIENSVDALACRKQ